ncbi:MAG TPA: hypothetical protein VFB00_06345 [Terriglobales bacterium]|nr:hypothetical protein [Terriglobales bacterium]
MSTYIEIAALVLVGFVVLIAIAAFVFDLRRRKHKGVSREEFIRAFARDGIPREILDAVYKFFTRSWFFGKLTIAPDDSLEIEADVEEDAALLMKKLGLKPPSEEARLRWNEQIQTSRGRSSDAPRFSMDSNQPSPIQTVRDMVLWLDWVRQHQNPISR